MAKYILSPNAQRSLKKIRDYSLKNFGKSQTLIYLKNLRNKINYLADDHRLGKIRDDIKQGYYSAYYWLSYYLLHNQV